MVRADKHPIGAAAALPLARAARRLVVAKGKKTVDIDMAADPPDDDALAALIIGPSGNLRAPAIRVGDTLVVGFTPDGLTDVLG